MTSDQVRDRVRQELAAWEPPVVEAGATTGKPWPAERYAERIEVLRGALVTPYQQQFELRETDDPSGRRIAGQAAYWVVAATTDMLLWFDEATGEFGVAEPGGGSPLPTSIGLRGDLVGSFCSW